MLYSTQGYSSLQWKDVKPRCMRRNPKEPGCKIPRVLSQWSHTGCTESQLWCDNICAVLCTWDAHLSLGVQGFYWGRGSHVDTHALMAGHSYWRSRRKALVKPQIPSFEQTRSTVQCSSRLKKKKKKDSKEYKTLLPEPSRSSVPCCQPRPIHNNRSFLGMCRVWATQVCWVNSFLSSMITILSLSFE